MSTKSLSQRISHITGSLNLKSLLHGKPDDAVPRKHLRLDELMSCVPGDAGQSNWSDVDISAHLAELKWALKNRNTAHLKVLLTHTQNYRYM